MASRSVGTGTSPVRNDILGSSFDARKPPRLPSGISKEIHVEARSILKDNPHLWTPEQVAPVVRLAILRHQVQQMNDQIAKEGFTIEHPKKGVISHPLLPGVSSCRSAALALERALGIVFISQNAQTKIAERAQLAKPKQHGRSGVAKLRLA